MIVQGQMFRNGHGRCGGCGYFVGAIAGGRQKRKAEGWKYSGRHMIGWACRHCARWAVRSSTPKTVHLQGAGDVVDDLVLSGSDNPSVRGFGLAGVGMFAAVAELVKRGNRRQKNAARRARRTLNRAAGLPPNHVETATMSSTEYRRWKARP